VSWRRPGLASARTKAGEALVGTRDALLVPGREIRWEEILTADWDSDSETLTLVLVDPEVLVFLLDESALLLQLVRERVMASIVLTRWIPVDSGLDSGSDSGSDSGTGFTVMARRPPGGGAISIRYEYDRGVDPDDPGVQVAASEALREVRDELGL
jgi:hypothetical protein